MTIVMVILAQLVTVSCRSDRNVLVQAGSFQFRLVQYRQVQTYPDPYGPAQAS